MKIRHPLAVKILAFFGACCIRLWIGFLRFRYRCQGADVQRFVHHLSVYLGHARLAHTQVYLTMTPELLQQAGKFFERYLRGEDNHA